MKVVPFEGWHFDRIKPQAAQGFAVPYLSADAGDVLARAGPAYTGMDGDTVVGCFGVVRIGDHRGIAWALLSEIGPEQFLKVHRVTRRWLDEDRTPRIEVYVRTDHAAGHRWAKMLGFEWECGPMRRFDPDGNDYDVYVMFNG